ncbi:MAG: hypothetical protein ABIJ91_00895 [Candidatus Kuenenbacteria bacterium]
MILSIGQNLINAFLGNKLNLKNEKILALKYTISNRAIKKLIYEKSQLWPCYIRCVVATDDYGSSDHLIFIPCGHPVDKNSLVETGKIIYTSNYDWLDEGFKNSVKNNRSNCDFIFYDKTKMEKKEVTKYLNLIFFKWPYKVTQYNHYFLLLKKK